MTADWTVVLAPLALLLGIAACVAALVLARRLRAARAELAQLTERLAAMQEQTQRELLAMGQRVMEADKLVRRLGERLDTMENIQPSEPRYGQLESLLSEPALRDAATVQSEAEERLLALLRRAGN